MHDHSHENDSTRAWWIARPENTNKVFYGLAVTCFLLVLFDFIYFEFNPKEGHFDFENVTGFHAAYGFVAFIFVVVCGTQLRTYLMRAEDYYDIPYTPRVDDHSHGGHDHEHHDDAHDEHEDQKHHDDAVVKDEHHDRSGEESDDSAGGH